jgi:hypothetical protein
VTAVTFHHLRAKADEVTHGAPPDRSSEKQMTPNSNSRPLVALKLPARIGLLISFVRAVILAIAGNPHFPNPSPSLVTLEAAVSDLEKAEATVQARVRGAIEPRNAKRAALRQLLDVLAAFVQGIADADPVNGAAIIQSAGLSVAKPFRHGRRVFAAAQGVASGSVKVTAPVGAHRASYDWQWSTDGGKTWQLAPSTLQSKTVLTGFAPGSTVSIRFRVTTKAGEGEWSQPAALMVK